MFSTITSGALRGMESYLTEVEVDVSHGIPGFELVGMLSSEVKEARERVRVALKNSGIPMPPQRITVNLSPANIPKSGTAFDLPIAIGIITSMEMIHKEKTKDTIILGELGLGGEVKFVPGVLPMLMEAKRNGIKRCILPIENAEEGAVVEGTKVVGVTSFEQTIRYLKLSEEEQDRMIPPTVISLEELFSAKQKEKGPDFGDISGQEPLRRAVEVAAAGFHHLLMVGPPGSGKTMIAKRIPSVLPPLSPEESLEVSKIYSISGKLHTKESLIVKRPFYSPHHTISEQALAGGGKIPHPGMISLCHRGVLFLDEVVHFSNVAIETLRQPMEDKTVQISRSYGSVTFPADFMLVAAMNPCPCGYFPDRNRCSCTEEQIKRYVGRISGPILDRIDIRVEAPRVEIGELEKSDGGTSSAEMQKRISIAREMQEDRYRKRTIRFNADLRPGEIAKYCELGSKERRLMEKAFINMDLSARAYHRILKVARTIADLEQSERIHENHLLEAIRYRA